MKKQVDQSGRLEDARATVWAYADGESLSDEAITFGHVGKGAQAHDVAWKTFIGRREPDRRAAWPELRKVL